MNPLNNFPDLARSLKLLKISVDLEDVSEETFFGHWIKQSLREGKTLDCVKAIREQAKNNYPAMIKMIGKDLLNRIENL